MYNKQNQAFTLSEAIIAMAIIGLVFVLYTVVIKPYNVTDDSRKTMSEKTAISLEDASTRILLNNAILDDYTVLVYGNDRFSITDENVTPKMAKLYQKYLSDIDLNVDMTNNYFDSELTDYNRNKLGTKLKDIYSDFFYVNDGVLIGLRFYGTCSASEEFANPPDSKGKFQINNICGSIFYDINAYDRPNKLGSDQYIIPIYKRGLKFNNDN